MPLQVVCVERSGTSPGHQHVTTVGVAAGNTIIRYPVKSIRRLIKKGDVAFYCLDAEGKRVPVRRYRCTCGTKTVRTVPDDLTDGVLSVLPTCS